MQVHLRWIVFLAPVFLLSIVLSQLKQSGATLSQFSNNRDVLVEADKSSSAPMTSNYLRAHRVHNIDKFATPPRSPVDWLRQKSTTAIGYIGETKILFSFVLIILSALLTNFLMPWIRRYLDTRKLRERPIPFELVNLAHIRRDTHGGKGTHLDFGLVRYEDIEQSYNQKVCKLPR